MGIKEELLVYLKEISNNLNKISGELEDIKASENKKQKELKEAVTSKKSEELPTARELNAMTELYLDYCFGLKGENSGD